MSYTFHDFKKLGLGAPLAQAWLDQLGAAALINRKGSTWRALDQAHREKADTPAGALALITEKPSLVKRPVLDRGGALAVGFAAATYATFF